MKPRQPPSAVWPQAMPLWLAIAVLVSPATGLAQPDPDKASKALIQWLETDCEEGNFKSLTRSLESVVPGLIAALEKGPPPERREFVRQVASASYDELEEQARRKPKREIVPGKEAYVKRDLDNFDAQYRVRAAQALAAIGGAIARKALEDALVQAERGDIQIREDVRKFIQELLKRKR